MTRWEIKKSPNFLKVAKKEPQQSIKLMILKKAKQLSKYLCYFRNKVCCQEL